MLRHEHPPLMRIVCEERLEAGPAPYGRGTTASAWTKMQSGLRSVPFSINGRIHPHKYTSYTDYKHNNICSIEP